MTNPHPLRPSNELLASYGNEFLAHRDLNLVATSAYQDGADVELKACCEWVQRDYPNINGSALRAARRPKPPNLAEVWALKALQHQIDTSFQLSFKAQERVDLIRAAFERLQELENTNG